MLQMPLVMQKFYEYYEEIYSEKDQKFIEETGRERLCIKSAISVTTTIKDHRQIRTI